MTLKPQVHRQGKSFLPVSATVTSLSKLFKSACHKGCNLGIILDNQYPHSIGLGSEIASLKNYPSYTTSGTPLVNIN